MTTSLDFASRNMVAKLGVGTQREKESFSYSSMSNCKRNETDVTRLGENTRSRMHGEFCLTTFPTSPGALLQQEKLLDSCYLRYTFLRLMLSFFGRSLVTA